jgi:hypothetical protein
MHRIDNSTAKTTLPPVAVPGQPGYFTNGSPLTGEPATVVEADWMNAVQEEISFVIETSGLVLNKQDRTQLYQAITRLTRLRLAAPATFWCSPTGSDGNPGTQALPWASLQHAYNFIRDRIDMNGQQCTVQLMDGTYAGAGFQYPAVGPWIKFVGNQSDPTRTVIHSANGPGIAVTQGGGVFLDSLTLRADGAPGGNYSWIGMGLIMDDAIAATANLYYDVCTAAHIVSQHNADGGSQADNVAYTIIGGAPYHLMCASGGTFGYQGSRITILNNPQFSGAFAEAQSNGHSDFRNTVFNGTARGPRYLVATGGYVQTGTNDPNHLPGDAAGVNNGGYYD